MKIWVKWLILGIISVAFGIFVLANPVAASIAVTTLAGIMFVVSGGFQIWAGLSEEGTMAKVLGIALGVLMVLLGGSLLFHPLARRYFAGPACRYPVRGKRCFASDYCIPDE